MKASVSSEESFSEESSSEALTFDSSRIVAVLFRPIYPRNIGMCARAMANMGLSRLVIVGRMDDLGDEAKQGAAHAQTVLRSAVRYENLDAFMKSEGEGTRIALSGKDARLKVPDDLETVLTEALKDASHRLRDASDPIYLFFGPEDDGLAPEELEICHFVCRLPTFSEVTSLNLSHAVLLTSYIVRTALTRVGVSVAQILEPAPIVYPTDVVHRWLEALGFDLSSPRINVEKTLNRIILSHAPTPDELRTLQTVLEQTVRKLKSR